MTTNRFETAIAAERLVEKFIDAMSHHLTTSNNMADLRRNLEIDARAALRSQWDDGYSAGIADAIDKRPSDPASDTPRGKGSIVPPSGATG